MAERLAKVQLKSLGVKNIKVLSRGLLAKGENITDNAKAALKEFKASGANRKSVKLGKLDNTTLYVTMTTRQAEEILSRLSSAKVISFSSLLGQDIVDPYGQDLAVYRDTARQIQAGVKALLDKILHMERKV